MPIHPISFSIPLECIVDSPYKKTQTLGTVIPGNQNTYIFKDDYSYNSDYQKSYFAITKKKSGWDCFRHYEILANGCFPYFIDLDKCPTDVMTNFPKKIVIEYMKKIDPKSPPSDLEEYNQVISNLLDYTRNNLSTINVAKYVLQTIRKPNVTKVLFLNKPKIFPDYLRCLTIHGFKTLLKDECHDYPKLDHLYSDFKNKNTIYGKGINYAGKLDRNCFRNDSLDKHIEEHIKSHYYDLIVFPFLHKVDTLQLSFVNKFYSPDEIVMLCGEDIHKCKIPSSFLKYNLFIREKQCV